MQKFRHFGLKQNFTRKSHLRLCCTKPFNLMPSKDVIRQLRLGVLDYPADVTTLLGPSFPWDSAVNQSGTNFAKFENSQKIEDKSYDDNFFTVVIRSTRSFWGAKKIFGVRCTLNKIGITSNSFSKSFKKFFSQLYSNCY